MSGQDPKRPSDAAIQVSESIGGVVLPTLLSLAYGAYVLIFVDQSSNNGWILTSLSILTLITAPAISRRSSLIVPAYLLGIYLFGIIGLFALGLAVSEGSSWGTIALSVLWTLLGWRLLAKAAELRRGG